MEKGEIILTVLLSIFFGSVAGAFVAYQLDKPYKQSTEANIEIYGFHGWTQKAPTLSTDSMTKDKGGYIQICARNTGKMDSGPVEILIEDPDKGIDSNRGIIENLNSGQWNCTGVHVRQTECYHNEKCDKSLISMGIVKLRTMVFCYTCGEKREFKDVEVCIHNVSNMREKCSYIE